MIKNIVLVIIVFGLLVYFDAPPGWIPGIAIAVVWNEMMSLVYRDKNK